MTARHQIAFILIASTALSSCDSSEDRDSTPVRPVLSVVAGETAAASTSFTGVIEPKVKTDVGFRVLGRMITRKVGVGDTVRSGEVLATIEPLALQMAVRSARADLKSAQAQLENATTTEKRRRVLLESRSGSQADLEVAEQDRRTAAATVTKAQAALDKATEQLSYAELRADFDGVIVQSSAEVGQVVSAGQTVMTIAQPYEREAVIDIPEVAASRLKIGDAFDIALQVRPSVRVMGLLRELAPQAEASTRTRRARISLAFPTDAFRLGSVVSVTMENPSKSTILLPASAILRAGDTASVWLIDPAASKTVRRAVKIEQNSDQSVAVRILNGVNAGDRIVTAGVHTLREGQAIRVDARVDQ